MPRRNFNASQGVRKFSPTHVIIDTVHGTRFGFSGRKAELVIEVDRLNAESGTTRFAVKPIHR